MKEYKFSKASKKYVATQLARSILLTLSIIITATGLFIKGDWFYSKILGILSFIGIIIIINITKKARNIDNIFYIVTYKDRFQINRNITSRTETIYFKEVKRARFDKNGIKFYVGYREYRILASFLEESDLRELVDKFEYYY